jgi:hypothetical protein
MPVKVISVSVPEYKIDKKPDYLNIGKKVDKSIEQNFSDRKYVYRAIGIDDHPDLSLDELVSIILKSGTDKYDPQRNGVCHDQYTVYDYDIQAGSFEIKDGKIVILPTDTYPTLFGDTIYDFYENAPQDRGYPVRVDILIFYDPNQLEHAKQIGKLKAGIRPELAKYLYRFKDRENKKNALLGIVKILR